VIPHLTNQVGRVSEQEFMRGRQLSRGDQMLNSKVGNILSQHCPYESKVLSNQQLSNPLANGDASSFAQSTNSVK